MLAIIPLEVYKDTILTFIIKSFDVARPLQQIQQPIAACVDIVFLFVNHYEN